MSAEKPRRSRLPEAPDTPSGYRQTRRGSTALRSARRAQKKHDVALAATRGARGFRNVLLVIVQALAIVGLTMIVLLLIANGVNTFVRWNSQRIAEKASSPEERDRLSQENVLIVGVDGDKAVGFLAVRVDRTTGQVFGIAIPDGAFVDIPGRGFERMGEAWEAGADVALSTVSNFFTVPFVDYVAVPADAYQSAVSSQSVSALPSVAVSSSLSADELASLTSELEKIPQKSVALVPLPVKPIKLGDQTYFEPQRDEIADLLKTWWGVDVTDEDQAPRVIVYNGAGKPGIAGQAAQVLIRSGFRVIDTKNADDFNYKKTEIVVRRGDLARGEEVRKALGIGSVVVDTSTADVTDVIVIIGKDYKPK
ncbi:MAG: LytR C-terminal domain-containing protein [Coriobacteriia bacterium]|nr:LytR C-terminal domain-containing protein [Coriobacteriia bacterium]